MNLKVCEENELHYKWGPIVLYSVFGLENENNRLYISVMDSYRGGTCVV